jgi:DNA-binding NtrC family response regulator
MLAKNILVVDDDTKCREFIKAFLTYKGYRVSLAVDAMEALKIMESATFDLVVTDLMMPGMNGLAFLKRLKAEQPDLVVIVSSAFSSAESTENLLQAGAYSCLDKPFDLQELESLLQRALEQAPVPSKSAGKPTVKNRKLMDNIIGESPKMRSLLELVEKVADSDSTALILGESGTGKELIAQAIHKLSNRKNNNFVPVNCGAIPEDLLESELFGHVKGSFTGAIANRVGRFAMADKGTLFLDEIGDMPTSLQVKLLRVLQSREIEPVGGSCSRKVDTRIIAATHQNLEELVASKLFREDLFYRLSVIPIVVPPLRERKEDIPLLVESFLKRMNQEKHRQISGIAPDALQALCEYQWPGNIRELENLMERLVIIKGSGTITLADLPEKFVANRQPAARPPVKAITLPTAGINFNDVIEEFENSLIMDALEKTQGNKKEAAELLNLKRTTLIEKLKKKNLASPSLHFTA